ncbi:MAG: HAMP domain-containing histidine kinase, partial [Planctomycetales bacterium]|nr:HAMP domain-containing histidine kinase [Planctomycetales bacterium]
MFVCASTECFPELGPREQLERLVDLEYTVVELALHESGGWLKPSEVLADPERAVNLCRGTHRMTVAALSVDIQAEGEAYYEQFSAICRLAKAIKVVTLVLPSSEMGTPFNEEIDRLQKLSSIASLEGAVVAMKTQVDRMSQDIDTSVLFCNNEPGLRITLDPSCMIYGAPSPRSYDKLLDKVQHVHLRDTSKNELQVRVGQGVPRAIVADQTRIRQVLSNLISNAIK